MVNWTPIFFMLTLRITLIIVIIIIFNRYPYVITFSMSSSHREIVYT